MKLSVASLLAGFVSYVLRIDATMVSNIIVMNRLRALLFLKFATPKTGFITALSGAFIALLFFSVPVTANACIFTDFGCVIGEGLAKLGGLIVGMAGFAIDFVVNNFVFNMRGTLTPGGPEAFDFSMYKSIWVIVRDLANLTFIFILLYAAITTILQVQKENLGRIVARLVVVAILMNFSLFFVQVGIDLSNYTSLQIYKNVEIKTSDGTVLTGGDSSVNSLSMAFMNVLQLTSMTQPASQEENELARGIMIFIFSIIAAGVLLAGAVMFFIRFFMLLIYMILSPVALAAAILPRFEEHFKSWREGLMKQLLFAPVYFLMIYLSLRFLQSIKIDYSGNGWQLWGQLFVVFGVAAAFLVYSLIAASKIGATGASAISSKAASVGKWTANKVAGTPGWAARNTIGRGANALREGAAGTHLSRMAVSDSVVARRLGRLGLGALDKTRDANFDLRNTATARKMGLKGEKRGFKKIDDAKKKERAERTKAYLKDAVKLTASEKKAQEEAKKRVQSYDQQITDLENKGNTLGEQISSHESAEQDLGNIAAQEQQAQERLNNLTTKLHDQFGVGIEKDIEAKKQEILSLQAEVGSKPMNEIESLRHEQKIRAAQTELKDLEDKAANSVARRAAEIDTKEKEIATLQEQAKQPMNERESIIHSEKILKAQDNLRQLREQVGEKELEEYRNTTQQIQTVEQQMSNLVDQRQEAQSRLVENIDAVRAEHSGIGAQVQAINEQKQADSLVADLENQVKTLYEAKVTDMKGPGGEFWRRMTVQMPRTRKMLNTSQTEYSARVQKRQEHEKRLKEATAAVKPRRESEGKKAARVTTESALNIEFETNNKGETKATIKPERGVGDSYYKKAVQEHRKGESEADKLMKQFKALQDKIDKQNNDASS